MNSVSLGCRLLLVCLIGSLVAGCARRQEATSDVEFAEEESDYVLAVVFDLSGSFSDLMANEGKGYEFAVAVLDRYFRNRSGTRDKVVLAQISGTSEPLLWEGSPLQLRQDFPTADSFRQFLLGRADPNGSLAHDGLAKTINYLSADRRVARGKAQSAVFVLSDMLDNSADSAAEDRLADAIDTYARTDGTIAMYYVNQTLVPHWEQQLRDAGVRKYLVECEIVGRPRLPGFE